MQVTHTTWALLMAFVLITLAIDLFAHRDHREIQFKEAAIWSTVWIGCGLSLGAIIWMVYGREYGLQYLTGYVVEKSLAVDNVFVWGLIFTSLAIPLRYQHRVLFLGVVGALLFRSFLILAGGFLIHEFSWTLYLFGAFLIFTGFKMFIQRHEELELSSSKFYQLLMRRFRVGENLDGEKFVTRSNGVLIFTPLFIALAMVEFMDLIFAFDSIPAIFAITEEPFLVFASNALALLGLRSMYFLIANLLTKFVYLKEGLSVILIWVGVKTIVSHALFKIPTLLSLGVIALVMLISIAASIKSQKNELVKKGEEL